MQKGFPCIILLWTQPIIYFCFLGSCNSCVDCLYCVEGFKNLFADLLVISNSSFDIVLLFLTNCFLLVFIFCYNNWSRRWKKLIRCCFNNIFIIEDIFPFNWYIDILQPISYLIFNLYDNWVIMRTCFLITRKIEWS